MSERSFAALAELPEMNPGPVLKLDLEGIIELANPAATSIYDVPDLIGRAWRPLCPELDDAAWDAVRDGSERVHCTSQVGDRTFHVTVAHRRGSPHVFVYGSDVSDLKAAEAKLADLAEFPEMNPGPVIRLDTGGCIVLANRATRDLIGREDVRGESWLDLCPGVDETFFARVLDADRSLTIEARIGQSDFVFSHVRAPSGREVFVYGTDVTDEKAAERAVLQSEKLATLGTLVAGVAHELNNPAAAAARASEHLKEEFTALEKAELALDALTLDLKERAQLAALQARAHDRAGEALELDALERSDREQAMEARLQGFGVDEPWGPSRALVELGLDDAELDRLASILAPAHIGPVLVWASRVHGVYRLLDEITQGAGRVSEIVGALKSYAYLGQAAAQNVDVNEGLRQTLIVLRSKLKYGVRIVQELGDDLPSIHGFGSELNQVWTNLIDNAVGAMNGEGTLALRTYLDDEHVVVEVEDDGPGIPEDVIGRVFDPFFTTKAPGEGTGLGLHTCQSIVMKKHGGTIHATSEPGATRFTVRLPLDGAAASGPRDT